MFPYVGQDHRTIPKPGISTNGHTAEAPSLGRHWSIAVAKRVLLPTAEDVDVTANQGVIANLDHPQGAASTNVDSVTDARFAMCEPGSKLDVRINRAPF